MDMIPQEKDDNTFRYAFKISSDIYHNVSIEITLILRDCKNAIIDNTYHIWANTGHVYCGNPR